MKKSILFIFIFVIAGFLIGFNGFAQDEDIDVNVDEDITAEDLEVAEPKLLPDSPLYFFKDLWRTVRNTFTFNVVSKAELQLKYANQRLIEAQKLAQKTDKEEFVEKAVEKYQQNIEKIKEKVEKFKEKAEDNPKIDKFLDKYTDKTIKHQRIMDRLEKNLSDKPEVLEKIKENREKALEHFGSVMQKLEDKDKIPERLEKNLEKIKGSKYKNFKNLEILMELEEQVPEQAKEAIQKAQQNSLKRLHGDLENMSAEDQERFDNYLEKVGGNQVLHLRILEKLEGKSLLPTLEVKLEQNREQVRERIQAIERDAEQIREQAQEQNREQVCITLWDPVCGKDGKTYSNACFAKLAGVEIDYRGKCKEPETIETAPRQKIMTPQGEVKSYLPPPEIKK